jgi:hypothetical protein
VGFNRVERLSKAGISIFDFVMLGSKFVVSKNKFEVESILVKFKLLSPSLIRPLAQSEPASVFKVQVPADELCQFNFSLDLLFRLQGYQRKLLKPEIEKTG